MDNEKLIAQISSTEETSVERVSLRRSQNSSLSARMPQNEELRKKTIRIEGMAKSRLTKLRIQESFDKLKNALPYEYGDNLILNLKSNDVTIYTRWFDGITLKESHLKEEPLKPEEVVHIKNKLKLWVRIFEHMSFFHVNGIIHGNLKPENILIRDRASVDTKQIYESEFFDKKADVPHVILLDGGYSHFLEFHKECLNYEVSRTQMSTEKKVWLSPEAHGFLEGSYRENSDIYSLAAIMAWDFGLIELDKHSILKSMWGIYTQPEVNTFHLNNKVYKWGNRNSLSDMLKRLRTVLLRALEPMAEKRTINAKDMAFEIMLMANRLVDTLDVAPLGVFDIKSINELPFNNKKEILVKNFELPEKIIPFILSDERLESNRLWIEARNKTANKHSLMRSINSGLNIVGKNCYYFGVKTTQSKIPFYNLDMFCNSLLSYILHINPQFIEELRSIFSDIAGHIESIFFVLPSLRNYMGKMLTKKQTNRNSQIQIKHEYIQRNIENIILKIIENSNLNFIILDDINRADHSSTSVFLKIISNQNIKWILGIRLDEDLDSELTSKNLMQMKHKDLSFASLKDNRTIAYWITKINTLTKTDAKMLSIFSINPTAIDIENFEALSTKFSATSGNYNNENILVNEVSAERKKDEDLIPSEDQYQVTKPSINSADVEEKQNKDSLYIASEVFKRAINLGLITENRDILTGHLISYYWEHQFVLQCLSMILSPKVKAEIYHSLFSVYNSNSKENETLFKIILITDCLLKSKINQSHLGAYLSLTSASEELCDIFSTEYIIKKFQILEETIELDRPKESSILIPKIREKIADISRAINKNEIAVKYYDAVSWNVVNRKNRSILMLKSFFPSQIRNRDQRTKEFYRIMNVVGKSGFFPELKNFNTYNFKNNINQIINKIEKKLSEESSYLKNNENQGNKEVLKNILTTIDNNPEYFSDNLNEEMNSQTYKSIRDKVMSYFLRSCIGWIDNYHICPYVIKSLQFAADNNDGDSTIHLLFSLILASERNLSVDLRNDILEIITDLGSRIGNTYTLYEVLLTRGWLALFCDGNLTECKKNIDRLNSSINELPFSIRQCLKKLQIICEFETLSPQSIENRNSLNEKYIKKFQDYELTDWSIGYSFCHIKNMPTSLNVITGDTLFVGNILNEKADQVLLYSHFLIEDGHANASSLVCNEAKNLNIRAWFLDTSSHIEYVNEKMANHYVGIIQKEKSKNTGQKEKLFSSFHKRNNLFIQSSINKLKSYSYFNKLVNNESKPDSTYWGDDLAILYNIKIDLAKTQDTEKLHFLAQNLVRTGFLWSAFRVAHKARCNLTTILNEIREKDRTNLETQTETESIVHQITQKTKEDNGQLQYDKSGPYPEQGVALNYILEFLHNFQHEIQESKLSYEELQSIAGHIKKSIPKDTDIIESTLAGALKAYVKRLQIETNESELDKPQKRILSIAEQPPEDENKRKQLPKAG